MEFPFWNPKPGAPLPEIEKMAQNDVIISRLKEQLAWYDHKSTVNAARFKFLKILTMVSASLIPLVAVLGDDNLSRVAAGLLGLLVTVCEGIQQLNQYQQNWISYRATAEALKHEMYTFGAQAGDYADQDEPARYRRLAERVESLVSVEHAKWIGNQAPNKTEVPDKSPPPATPPHPARTP